MTRALANAPRGSLRGVFRTYPNDTRLHFSL